MCEAKTNEAVTTFFRQTLRPADNKSGPRIPPCRPQDNPRALLNTVVECKFAPHVTLTTFLDICNSLTHKAITAPETVNQAMQQFVLYRRVSTKEQGKSGLGLSAQQRDLDLFLTNHAETPFEIIGDFEDVLSGADNSRPALTAAIDMCRKTGATLLVSKLDRLSRKVSFIATLMEDPKLTFRVASIPMASKIELHLYAMLAEQERDFISLRTKAALAEAKAKGSKLGGLRPKTEERNKAIQANAKARADKVALTVQPLRAQGATLREIAEALNTSGVATARGGRWQASQVKRVLERLEG